MKLAFYVSRYQTTEKVLIAEVGTRGDIHDMTCFFRFLLHPSIHYTTKNSTSCGLGTQQTFL